MYVVVSFRKEEADKVYIEEAKVGVQVLLHAPVRFVSFAGACGVGCHNRCWHVLQLDGSCRRSVVAASRCES